MRNQGKKGTGKLADPKKEIVKEEKPKQVTWRVAAVAAVMACADSDNKLHGLSSGAVASVKYRDAHNCSQNRVKRDQGRDR